MLGATLSLILCLSALAVALPVAWRTLKSTVKRLQERKHLQKIRQLQQEYLEEQLRNEILRDL